MCAEGKAGEGRGGKRREGEWRDPINDILVSFLLSFEMFFFCIETLPLYIPVISRSCLESNSIHEIRFSPGLISLSVNTSTTNETFGYQQNVSFRLKKKSLVHLA